LWSSRLAASLFIVTFEKFEHRLLGALGRGGGLFWKQRTLSWKLEV
jgi:hypothetical protein